MAVDIFICRTAARDTERCASSCFLAPPALCLPESPVTKLYIRRSRCSTMLHSLHHWSKMKACKFKDVSPEPPWTVFCSTEWMQVWIFFWVSAVPFCMWVVVPTIWSNPRRERLIQGSGNSAVTQTQSLPAAKQSLQRFCCDSGLRSESRTYRRYESLSNANPRVWKFERRKKKKIHSDVRKCSVALLHLLKKQKRSNHYKDGTVQVAAGTSPPLRSGDERTGSDGGNNEPGPNSQAHLKTCSRARKPRQCWTGFREQIPQSPWVVRPKLGLKSVIRAKITVNLIQSARDEKGLSVPNQVSKPGKRRRRGIAYLCYWCYCK